MSFSIEQAFDAFWDNSGGNNGNGVEYGGTGMNGTITGTPTGGSTSGSTGSPTGGSGTGTSTGGSSNGGTDGRQSKPLVSLDDVSPIKAVEIFARDFSRFYWDDITDAPSGSWGNIPPDSGMHPNQARLIKDDVLFEQYLIMKWYYAGDRDSGRPDYGAGRGWVVRDPIETDDSRYDVGGNSTTPTGEVSSFTVRMTFGTSGNDATYGGSGSEFLYGGDGNDILYGYTGNDIIQGGAGADTMDGGDGIDLLDYREDTAGVYIDVRTNSAFHGEAEGDRISGFENVTGGSGNDTIYGSHDANMIWGGNGNDIIAGAGGDDTVSGNPGNDVLYGDAGNDLVVGGEGADIMDGGDGIDTLNYSPGTYENRVGVYIDVRTNTALYGDAEGDRISGFENVIGGWGNDTIYGSDDANVLDGSIGSDTLAGAGGNDTLWGSTGNDWLEGGNGNDVIAGGDDFDFIQGGAGADTLDGGDEVDTLDYSNDNAGVYIDVRTNSAFHGEASGDVISNFENVNGGAGHDTIYGSDDDNVLRGQNGHDILAGAGGNDALYGDSGNDWLEGGNGNDRLFGGNDSDRLVGGAGNDLLQGGEGRDTFVFDAALNATSNVDVVYDFSASDDTIALSRSIFGGFGSSVWVAVGNGAGPGGAQIVYDDMTGDLFYDADGAGGAAQVQFAHLAAGLVLTAGNFVLI